jgi:hypothetical protein
MEAVLQWSWRVDYGLLQFFQPVVGEIKEGIFQ